MVIFFLFFFPSLGTIDGLYSWAQSLQVALEFSFWEE
jgi:hypothetical protein